MKRRSHSVPCPPLRGAVLCGLVALLAALLAVPAAGAGSKIAFAKYEPSGKRSHIWTITPNGSGLKRLTSGTPYDLAPAWSPGRGTIAFMRFASGDPYKGRALLMLMRANGSNVRRLAYEGPSLTSGTDALAYSPNGRQIALTVEYGGGSGLLKVDVASGRLLKTHEGDYNTGSVSWRPDGKNLLCSMYRAPGSTHWTYLAKPDGSRIKRVGREQGDPAYSPDGSNVKTIFKSSGKEYIDSPAWR